MTYEQTPIKPVTNPTKVSKAVYIQAASKLSTPSLAWLLIKRHKVAILTAGNIILVLNWAIPAWPEIVKSII